MHISYGTIVARGKEDFDVRGNKSQEVGDKKNLATLCDKTMVTISNTHMQSLEGTFPRIRCIAGRDLSDFIDKYNLKKKISLAIPTTVKCRQFTLDPPERNIKRAKLPQNWTKQNGDNKPRKRKKPETLSSKLNALKEKSKIAARTVHTHILGASLASALEELETREKAAADTLRETMQVHFEENDSWKKSTDPILSSVLKNEDLKTDFDDFNDDCCDVIDEDNQSANTEISNKLKLNCEKEYCDLRSNIKDWSSEQVSYWITKVALNNKEVSEKTIEILKSKVCGVNGKDFCVLKSEELFGIDKDLVELIVKERDKMMQLYEQNIRMRQPFVTDPFPSHHHQDIELPNLSDVSELLDNPTSTLQLADVALSVPPIDVFSKQSHVKPERVDRSYYSSQQNNHHHHRTVHDPPFSIAHVKSEPSQLTTNSSHFSEHTSYFNDQLTYSSDQYFSNCLQWSATPKENLHYKANEWNNNSNGLSPTSDSDSGIHSPTGIPRINFTSGYTTSRSPYLVTSQISLPPCGVFSHTPVGVAHCSPKQHHHQDQQKSCSANWEIIALNQQENVPESSAYAESSSNDNNDHIDNKTNAYYYVNNGMAGQLYRAATDCQTSNDDVTDTHQATATLPAVAEIETDRMFNKCTQKPIEEEFTFRFKATSGVTGKSCHLWEFIRDTLLDDKFCPKLIKWEDRTTGVFRFVQSDAIAKMWGDRKNNPKMTYEKLSRAMRYYYNRGILERVDGRRLVYKFGKNSHGWKENEAEARQQDKRSLIHPLVTKKEFFNFPCGVDRKRTQQSEIGNPKKSKMNSSENDMSDSSI